MTAWQKLPDGTWKEVRGGEAKRTWYSGFTYPDTPQKHCRRATAITTQGHREVLLGRIERAREQGRGVS